MRGTFSMLGVRIICTNIHKQGYKLGGMGYNSIALELQLALYARVLSQCWEYKFFVLTLTSRGTK